MSTHGKVPPANRFPARGSGPNRPFGWLRLALNVLAREAVLGLLLWCGNAGQISVTLVFYLLGLCATISWTGQFGLTRPASWRTILKESLTLYLGAVCVSNLLLVGLGLAPWWQGRVF
jgi:hypothetical protein